MTLDEVNGLEIVEFAHRFGDVAENAPWVAESAAHDRPFADRQAMIAAFERAIDNAAEDEQLALLREHPDLAGRAAVAGDLTAESAREQTDAGLDRLSQAEHDRFTALNDSYRERFGFPFILAVKGASKERILAEFEDRLDNDPQTELTTAIAQVKRIVRFRLEERVQD